MAGRFVVAGALVAAAALAGCGSSTAARPSPSASRSSSPTTLSTAVPDSPLKSLVLTGDEVMKAAPRPPVVERAVIAPTALSGDGSATLEGTCSAKFPSEALRTQRLQVEYDDDENKRTVESNEVVRYSSVASATQAFHELQAAVTGSCTPSVLWQVDGTKVEAPDPALGSEQVILTGSIRGSDAAHNRGMACYVYQFHGDLFSGMYVNRPTVEEAKQAALALAEASAAKLTAQAS